MVRLELDDKSVRLELEALIKRYLNPRPLMKAIGQVVRTSVLKNFEHEGRPGWQKGHKKAGQTLTDSGHLKNSIAIAAGKDSVAIGTNVIYAGTHQFGAEQGYYGTHIVRVPAHKRRSKNDNTYNVRTHTKKQ
ncbi:MAG: phage virion morphogenesis protein, partial [Deltaproteobacteria bacterium]